MPNRYTSVIFFELLFQMWIDTITAFLAGDGGLWTLAVSAFLSATLLPGSSEAVLVSALLADPTFERVCLLVTIASFANTAGSMTSWFIGRMIAHRPIQKEALLRLKRYGAPILILAWVPIIGDALPVAAGWLRMKFLPVLLWTGLGKTLRYTILALTAFNLI